MTPAQIRKSLEKVKRLFADENIAKAEERLAEVDTEGVKDTEILLEIADLCEQVGLVDRVPRELGRVLKLDSDNITALRKLAAFYRDSGGFEKSERFMRKLIKVNPKDLDAYRELGALLEEMNDWERALEVYEEATRCTGDASFGKMAKSASRSSHIPEEEPPEAATPGVPTEGQVLRFLKLFSGREGVYSRQWVSPTGESGYTPIREPLNFNVARNHFLGNHTLGVYQLRVDNTVNFIAFDIDIPKNVVAKTIGDRKLWEQAQNKTHAYACRLVDIGYSQEIPVYIEDSGFKGRHCWICLEEPIPAKIARRFAVAFLNMAGSPPPEVEVEIFPKQVAVRGDGLGNLIKLPLGIHRKSGKRSAFISPEGSPYPDQLVFLETLACVGRNDLYAFLERLSPEVVVVEEPVEAAPGEPATQSRQAPSLQVQEYDLERDPEFQFLLLKCPVIRAVVGQIEKDGQISTNEMVVLQHTLGHLREGPQAVNALFRKCPGVEESNYLKSRLKGNPISCPKIRSRIPGVTSGLPCNCHFPPSVGTYPTPTLHVAAMERVAGAPVQNLDSLQFQNLIQDFFRVRRQLKELMDLDQKFQKRLNEFFDQTGVDSVQTQFGNLKRVLGEGGAFTFILEM